MSSLEDIPLPEGPAPRYRRSEYNGILFELNPHSAFEDVPLPNRTLGSDQELEFARPGGQEDHDGGDDVDDCWGRRPERLQLGHVGLRTNIGVHRAGQIQTKN